MSSRQTHNFLHANGPPAEATAQPNPAAQSVVSAAWQSESLAHEAVHVARVGSTRQMRDEHVGSGELTIAFAGGVPAGLVQARPTSLALWAAESVAPSVGAVVDEEHAPNASTTSSIPILFMTPPYQNPHRKSQGGRSVARLEDESEWRACGLTNRSPSCPPSLAATGGGSLVPTRNPVLALV